MRLKSMNKSSSSKNSTNISGSNNASSSQDANYDVISSGASGNGYDLDMDSGDDEIDVGTNADSIMVSYNSNNSYSSMPGTSAIAGVQNDHQFGNQQSSSSGFSGSHQSLSEADRKRAHHNALERKRRDHIKDSFHTLRDAIPNIKGEKTSRAQILKAATEFIKQMKNRNSVFQNDIDSLKKQNYEIEIQIRQLEKAKLAAAQCLKQQQQQATNPTLSQNVNSSILVKNEQI